MDILLFGASGTLGSRILNELLSRGHRVTAVVRGAVELPAHENLIETAGDIFKPDEIADAARGMDAVVSAYGPGPANPQLMREATRCLIAGVEASGVKRLVMGGGAGS